MKILSFIQPQVIPNLYDVCHVNDNQSCLITNILLNIFFCVSQKKDSHTGLESHEGK